MLGVLTPPASRLATHATPPRGAGVAVVCMATNEHGETLAIADSSGRVVLNYTKPHSAAPQAGNPPLAVALHVGAQHTSAYPPPPRLTNQPSNVRVRQLNGACPGAVKGDAEPEHDGAATASAV